MLLSDLPEEAIEPALRDLEQRRLALLAAGFPGFADPPGRLEAIELRSPSELSEFSSMDCFPVSGELDEGAVVLDAQPKDPLRRDLQLQLGTYLVLHQFRRVPPWLWLGYALYLSSLRNDAARGLLVVGDIPFGAAPDAIRGLSQLSSLGLGQMGGWARVHYLATERSMQFDDLLGRLGKGEKPTAAFAAAFPNLSGAELDEKARTHVKASLTQKITVATLPVPLPWRGLVATDKLTPAEVHVVFARLLRSSPSRRSREERQALAAKHLEAALALDPDEPSALMQGALQKLSKEQQWTRLKALVKQRPTDSRPLFMLAGVEYDGSEARESALRSAIALEPAIPAASARLAQELLQRDPKESLRHATYAVALAPWSAEFLAMQAAALAANGNCDEARAAQDDVLDRTARNDGLANNLTQWMKDSLGVVSSACGK